MCAKRAKNEPEVDLIAFACMFGFIGLLALATLVKNIIQYLISGTYNDLEVLAAEASLPWIIFLAECRDTSKD